MSVTATIDLASVSTGNDDRDAHLRSDDFFDVESHPTMTFTSTAIEGSGSGSDYHMVGDVAVAGVTKVVELDVEFVGQAANSSSGTNRAGFSATGEISRKDFGIEFNVPLDGGGLLMGDKVKIELDMQFVSPQ